MVVSGHSQSFQLTGLGKSLSLICQQQPRLNYKRGCTQPSWKAHLQYPTWVIGEAVHWTPHDTYYIKPDNQDTQSKQLHLIHRNKCKEAAKMMRQRNVSRVKDQNSRKRLNKMEISNLSDAEFKTLVIKMLKELSEDLSSIKNPVRNEGTLIEIKDNLQGNNSRVDKAKNKINDLEHKEATNQNNKKKKESKNITAV